MFIHWMYELFCILFKLVAFLNLKNTTKPHIIFLLHFAAYLWETLQQGNYVTF